MEEYYARCGGSIKINMKSQTLEKQRTESGRELNSESFKIYLNIKHWSGCWGGTVVKESVQYPLRRIAPLTRENRWLSDFLRNSDTDKIRLEMVSHTENGKREELSGQEYIVRVQLQNPEGDVSNFAIVACVDGKPAFSMPEYTHLSVGRDLFQGYKLEPGKSRYTLTLPYTLTEQGCLDHTAFAHVPNKTIIGAHLFMTNHELTKNADLAKIKPTLTAILVYDQSQKHRELRRRR